MERYVGNMNYRKFVADELVQDAVVRNLEIIGEASKKIPEEIKGKYFDIEGHIDP